MSALILSSFALLSAGATWWTWRRRFEAERAADEARREASQNRELADAGRAARDLAHDLGNLVAVMHLNLQHLDWEERERARQTVRDVQQAAIAVYRMFEEWRGHGRSRRTESSAVMLHTLCGLLGRTGLEVDPRVEAPLAFSGEDQDVVRVLENLLLVAGREAIRAGHPRVDVDMTADALRIASRARDPGALDARIDDGSGCEGSSGRGLAIARQAAARVGWRIVHALDGERLTFVVRRSGS